MIFKNISILFCIPFLIALLVFLNARRRDNAFRFPSKNLSKSVKTTWKVRFLYLPFFLRLCVLTLLCVALAGPRLVSKESIVRSEGIDIVLAIDASTSMAAEDFKRAGQRVNRLTIVKEVVEDFINGRTDDRIGLVAFSGLAFTVSPLTTDYSWLISNLERVQFGLIEDGTAVGSAIAASVSRLKDSEAKSKVVILLTDGINNAGTIEPVKAAQIAASYGIKIYTIGAGTKGLAPYPATDFFGRKAYREVQIDIDEKMLTEVASLTGGHYFRATDTKSLESIYKEIDKLEKTEIEEVGYYEHEEIFYYFLITALLFLALEIMFNNTLFLKIP